MEGGSIRQQCSSGEIQSGGEEAESRPSGLGTENLEDEAKMWRAQSGADETSAGFLARWWPRGYQLRWLDHLPRAIASPLPVPPDRLLPAARQLPVIISVLTMRCVSADGRAVSEGNRNRCSASTSTRGIFPTGLPLMISGVGIFQLQSDVDMAMLWVR